MLCLCQIFSEYLNITGSTQFHGQFFAGQLELFMKGQYQIAAEESTQDQDPLNKVIEDIEGEDGPMNGQ